jgi:hypothetical protein
MFLVLAISSTISSVRLLDHTRQLSERALAKQPSIPSSVAAADHQLLDVFGASASSYGSQQPRAATAELQLATVCCSFPGCETYPALPLHQQGGTKGDIR